MQFYTFSHLHFAILSHKIQLYHYYCNYNGGNLVSNGKESSIWDLF